ncbi:MAG: AbrB/MazE/SpoVT family DNA-binding domain-containing protein [Crenarchaeota archaeon]|nr:AbrB/MazE/SpoVT family DNA-binding domain-containing protein [Thermoproteota archaeon]MDA1124669.1 AbrB/MazE/SpoVT family DNA-binding domain-containing protein [Thermoproteota archaeon]
MAGKKNQFDPSEMYKQWLDSMSNAQPNFMNMNQSQPNMQNPFTNMQNPFTNMQNMMPNFLLWGAFKTTVGSNGRISIPEAERDALGIEEGNLVQIIIVPIKSKTN